MEDAYRDNYLDPASWLLVPIRVHWSLAEYLTASISRSAENSKDSAGGQLLHSGVE